MDKLIRELREENERLKKAMQSGDLSALMANSGSSGESSSGGTMSEDGVRYLSFFTRLKHLFPIQPFSTP